MSSASFVVIFFCVLQVSLEENRYFPCRETVVLIQHQGGAKSEETGHMAENNA